MSTGTYLRTRVEPVPSTLVLAVGDAAAIVAFIVAGEIQHNADPVGNPELVATGAAPFLLGWAVVAFFGGLYSRDAVASPRRAVSWAVPAWVVAVLLGHALRSTALFRGGTALSFVLVTMVVGGALLVGWRALAAVALGRRERSRRPRRR
jgi:hypothetical protein